MRFDLDTFHRDIPDDVILDDLRNAERALRGEGKLLSFRSYNDVGNYSAGTIAQRFGSWNKAVIRAGLRPTQEKNVSVRSLFDNLKNVWIRKGKQPTFRDMALPPSQYSASIYIARFGSWKSALTEFVVQVHSDEWLGDDRTNAAARADEPIGASPQTRKRTRRNPSDRLRFRILLRDGFECQTCGASPLKDRGVALQVDHILPWSEGGETTEENLQTKCQRCNLGKGNAFTQ